VHSGARIFVDRTMTGLLQRTAVREMGQIGLHSRALTSQVMLYRIGECRVPQPVMGWTPPP